jgi:hypothetical protein
MPCVAVLLAEPGSLEVLIKVAVWLSVLPPVAAPASQRSFSG